MKIRPGGGRVVPHGQTDGRTDMTKLRVDFQNVVNAPKRYKFTQMIRSFLLRPIYNKVNSFLLRKKNYARKCDRRP